MPKKYTSGELFGGAVPSDIKDIFKKKEKKKYLSDKEWKELHELSENLFFTVRKNYPENDIIFWLDSVCAFRKKLKKVL